MVGFMDFTNDSTGTKAMSPLEGGPISRLRVFMDLANTEELQGLEPLKVREASSPSSRMKDPKW
jgi:hypothetical protein